MKIGIGLPGTIPGVKSSLFLEWARRADAGPFSSLSIIDRLVYSNYEPLIALSAAAAVTTRIRLLTSILLVPPRETTWLAKQAATLDVISNGRLTLGLGIGGREDDFTAAGISFKGRGKRFEQQLATLKHIWAGQPPREGVGPIGPAPVQKGGPELLIGGYSPAAISRAGKLSDGYIAGGGGDAARVRQGFELVLQSWKEAGKPGAPRFVAAFYSVVGADKLEQAGAYLRSYYSFFGPMAEGMVQGLPRTPDAIRKLIHDFANVGVDELILWPTVAELEQLDLYADLVAKL
jgi:alkanesulfonate monooxygenase SsuD/methylene tetrahydromethanopterin reductase-like flavin-dependent oxidoreductase (luciferase family)